MPVIQILSPGDSSAEGHLQYCYSIGTQHLQVDLKTQQNLYTVFMYSEYKSVDKTVVAL